MKSRCEFDGICKHWWTLQHVLKCQICWVIGVIGVIWWFGDLVRIYFDGTNRCLRIMVPLFTNSTRNLVAYSHLLWLVACCIAKVVQLPGNWVFGRAWLEEAAWLFGVGWFYPFLIISIPKLGLQMSIKGFKGIVLMCFSSLVAHSSAPQPCWIKTTYLFLFTCGMFTMHGTRFCQSQTGCGLGPGFEHWNHSHKMKTTPRSRCIATNCHELWDFVYCSAFYQQVHKQYCSSNI